MKAAAGVITFFATVIGVLIAIQSRPAPYTLADWSTKANAVCEKDFSQQNIPLLKTLLALRASRPAICAARPTVTRRS